MWRQSCTGNASLHLVADNSACILPAYKAWAGPARSCKWHAAHGTFIASVRSPTAAHAGYLTSTPRLGSKLQTVQIIRSARHQVRSRLHGHPASRKSELRSFKTARSIPATQQRSAAQATTRKRTTAGAVSTTSFAYGGARRARLRLSGTIGPSQAWLAWLARLKHREWLAPCRQAGTSKGRLKSRMLMTSRAQAHDLAVAHLFSIS
jgi:hypothetical protein